MQTQQYIKWLQELREKRIAYNVSQTKLSIACGISRQYINNIENEKVIPSQKIMDSIDSALERFNSEIPLELLFDYVRIRFQTTDVVHVVKNILRLDLSYMIHEDYGLYSYTEHYYLGDVFIYVSQEKEKGILLELKGKGSRQFENYLFAQERSWFDFFNLCALEDAKMKRLDLAINDKTGILNIPFLTQKVMNEECVSVLRSFKSYRSGELTKKETKECMGNTLYIGSMKSEIYFCIYEKDYEQFIKNNIPIEDADVKNRFEIRLKNDRAQNAVNNLVEFQDIESTVFGIINRYMRFADKDKTKKRSDWKTSTEWLWFIGENRQPLRLTTAPEPITWQKTKNWLSFQVAPTWKIAVEADKLNGTNIIGEMLANTKLSPQQQKLLIQLTTSTEKLVI